VKRAAVEAALARLREARRALRSRRAAETVDALADVLDAWSAADSPWQKRLADALPAPTGFGAAMVREGLARGLAPYTGAALRALVDAELGGIEALETGRSDGFETTATVLAGAIPLPTFVAILAPLALRSPVLVKPPAHDPVTAPLLARSLAERDALLGACVEIADFRRDDAEAMQALCAAPCVAATGSDAAVAAIRARVAPSARFLASGHRFSVALLGPEAAHGEALARATDGLALDVALWDQVGCLSPVSVHVADADPRAADRVADALAASLDVAERRWPRGRVGVEVAAAIARERDAAALRGCAVAASRGTEWTVVREQAAALRASPLHRFVRVHPCGGAVEALDALRPHAAQLAAVALDGFGAAAEGIATSLRALGASRVCAPGTLQSPPLSWPRDGRGVLIPFARHA
jgi:hypothetical protein